MMVILYLSYDVLCTVLFLIYFLVVVVVFSPPLDLKPKVDTRVYSDLLHVVPQDAITIPLMLHCMGEQVCKLQLPLYMYVTAFGKIQHIIKIEILLHFLAFVMFKLQVC